MMIFWGLTLWRLVDTSASEKHSVYIFRAKVVMLETERIYVGLEESKAGGMDQSEPNEQYRLPHCRENLTSYMFILLVNALIGNAK
jgi:hypothetical protein